MWLDRVSNTGPLTYVCATWPGSVLLEKLLTVYAGSRGSTPTGGSCPNKFSDPIDQDIRTQCALSWKNVASEWWSVIAVSLNVGGGVRLIKPAKLYKCMQNTTHTEAMCLIWFIPWDGGLIKQAQLENKMSNNDNTILKS